MTQEQRDALGRLVQSATRVRVKPARHYECRLCGGRSPTYQEQTYLSRADVAHAEECAVMVVGRMLAEEEK